MNFKAIFAGSFALALCGLYALPGCGQDDCVKAGDHLAECLGRQSPNDTTNPSATTCNGVIQCVAQATNAASCDQIVNAQSAKPTKVSEPYLNAIALCTATGASSM